RVREAAFAALTRARDASAIDEAERVVRWDRSWRVRRAAALFAARAGGEGAVRVLEHATEDPFSRVPVAARRAAASLDACVVGAEGSTVPSSPADEGDPDPAVVVARLERETTPDLPALVRHLGHPHDPLRRLARRLLAQRAPPALLADAACRW